MRHWLRLVSIGGRPQLLYSLLPHGKLAGRHFVDALKIPVKGSLTVKAGGIADFRDGKVGGGQKSHGMFRPQVAQIVGKGAAELILENVGNMVLAVAQRAGQTGKGNILQIVSIHIPCDFLANIGFDSPLFGQLKVLKQTAQKKGKIPLCHPDVAVVPDALMDRRHVFIERRRNGFVRQKGVGRLQGGKLLTKVREQIRGKNEHERFRVSGGVCAVDDVRKGDGKHAGCESLCLIPYCAVELSVQNIEKLHLPVHVQRAGIVCGDFDR